VTCAALPPLLWELVRREGSKEGHVPTLRERGKKRGRKKKGGVRPRGFQLKGGKGGRKERGAYLYKLSGEVEKKKKKGKGI